MARRRRPPRPGALTELPPLKILTQIVLLQLIWYGVGTSLILFSALVAGKHFSLDLVLSWRSLRGDTTVGWMLGLVWLLNSFIGYALLPPVCGRELLTSDQRNITSSPYFAKQIGSRFRPHDSLHPSPRRIPLFTFDTAKCFVVDIADSQRSHDDLTWSLELPV